MLHNTYMIKQRTNPLHWLSIEGINLSVDEFPDGSFRFSLGVFDEQELYNVVLKTTIPEALHATHQVCSAIVGTYPQCKINLVVQTLPDQRADRSEDFGMAIPALTTCVFLSVMPVDQVEVYDVHSTAVLALLKDCLQQMNVGLRVNTSKDCFLASVNEVPDVIVAVDKGAVERAEGLAKHLSAKVVYLDKVRNKKGKVVGHEIVGMSHGIHPADVFWIVDDLCDGGATFLSAAHEIREAFELSTINLYVTHGLFSKGKEELRKYFDKIVAYFDYSEEQ